VWCVEAGGLLGVELDVDPALCRSDRLVGQLAGAAGCLPPVFVLASLTCRSLPRIKTTAPPAAALEAAQPALARAPGARRRLKQGEAVLLCVGAARVGAQVRVVSEYQGSATLSVELDAPVCAAPGSQLALFRAHTPQARDRADHPVWRLFGFGRLLDVEALPLQSSLPAEALPRNTKEKLAFGSEHERAPAHARAHRTQADVEASIRHALDQPSPGSTGLTPPRGSDTDSEPEPEQAGELSSDGQSDSDGEGEAEAGPEQAASAALDSKEEPFCRSSCRFRRHRLPVSGDVVMAYIERASLAEGAHCRLVEYGNTPAFIPVKELSAQRIRSIKAVVSASQGSSLSPCVVLKVERDPQAPGGVWVDLSRKRVTKPEAKACEDSYRDAKLVDAILRRVSALTGVSLHRLYKQVAWPIERRAHKQSCADPSPVLTAFMLSLHDPGAAFPLLAHVDVPALDSKGQGQQHTAVRFLSALLSEIRRRLPLRPVQVRARVALTCTAPHGSVLLREALVDAFPCPRPGHEPSASAVSITLESSPYFSIYASGLDHQALVTEVSCACVNLGWALHQRGGHLAVLQSLAVSVKMK